MALQVGQGAPSASLLWDTATLDMSLRVWKQKILLVLYLQNLDEETFASRVYKEQKLKKWPGLAAETTQICESLNIKDCNETHQDIFNYKLSISKALHDNNEEKLRLLGRGKCERFLHEDCGKKEYLYNKNISNVRKQYRTRYGLLPFAGNYSHNKKYAATNWFSRCSESREEECHLTSGNCKVFGDLQDEFGDLSHDENLIKFFNAVLSRRDEIDKVDLVCSTLLVGLNTSANCVPNRT